MSNGRTPTNKPIVFLDTNLVIQLAQLEYFKQIAAIINEFKVQYQLAVSLISRYEIYRGVGSTDINNAKEIIKLIKSLEVNEQVLTYAAYMYLLGIKDEGDSIIASTSFLNKGSILTSDKDFTEPYFHELKSWTIYKKEQSRTVARIVYLLETDTEKILKDIEKL